MAGESAEAVARRQREKAARLQQSAEQWQRGADGERATANVLDALPRQYWTVVHDVAWPGRPRANIDHVVIGPPGVVVIDSKNWSGTVTVQSGALRQSGRSRASSIAGVEDAARAVAGLLPPDSGVTFHGVLCLTGESQVSGNVGSVAVRSLRDLPAYLQTLPVAVPEERLGALASDVMSRLDEPRSVSPGWAATAVLPSPPSVTPDHNPRPATSRRSARPAAATRRRSAKRSSSARGRTQLLKIVPLVVFAGVLTTQPQVITNVASGISGLFVSQLEPPEAPQDPATENERKRKAQKRAEGDDR
jgi:hypothetical protein